LVEDMTMQAANREPVDDIRFSVVILTYARDDALGLTLDRLRWALGPRHDVEVILVDNNVDDLDRSAMVADFPFHQLVRTGVNKGVSARNDGMDVARGEIIALLDDDVLVETADFLDRFAAVFDAKPDVGVVNVRKLDGATMTLLPECVPHTRKSVDTSRPFETFRFVGGLVAMRRAVHATLGGFSPDFFYGAEEREYSYRIIKAGWKIYYSPDVVAIETNHEGGRKPRAQLRTETLLNTYIIAFLHKSWPVFFVDVVLFTVFLWIKERGRIDVWSAIRRFAAWLRRPDRARRHPMDRKALNYIRACGGATWR
jgi:GT2 family glycosyltransferase